MKSFVNRITIALVIVALSSVAAFAKTKRATITFPNNIKVNGTLVKQGTYDVKFDEAANELSILKGGKVIAKANTRAEKGMKADSLQFSSTGSGDERQLLSVTFSGSDQKLVVSGGEAASN
ncbi:MAG TPA: hypothetical protein VJM12_20365 [Pyrinomonadaceae bacterium]|nr:hypothetical protein [Pyrinomonadaceae bacterium]